MSSRDPLRRVRENAVSLVSTLVTGIWLAALLLDFGWWLAFMLFGYIVVVPVTALLFGDEEDTEEWWEDDVDHAAATERDAEDDALDTLRKRYARGELTDEQFERKLDRLLETETLEDVEDYKHSAQREYGSGDLERERS
jgi:uncharacterized membrane protein